MITKINQSVTGRGGKREGAGRKPIPSARITVAPGEEETLAVLSALRRIALGEIEASPTQVAAATAFLRHHARPLSAKAKAAKESEGTVIGIDWEMPL